MNTRELTSGEPHENLKNIEKKLEELGKEIEEKESLLAQLDPASLLYGKTIHQILALGENQQDLYSLACEQIDELIDEWTSKLESYNPEDPEDEDLIVEAQDYILGYQQILKEYQSKIKTE